MNITKFLIRFSILISLIIPIISQLISSKIISLCNIDKFYKIFPHTIIIIILFFLAKRVFDNSIFFISYPKKEIGLTVIVSLLFLNGLTFFHIPYGFNWISIKVILSNLSIGITEEIIFRGFCLGMLLIKFKNSNNGILKAAIYSSLAFSLIHMVNMINKDINLKFLMDFINQIIYTIGLGLAFAGITIRTKSLLIAILVHTIVDIIGSRSEFISDNEFSLQNPILDSILTVSYCLIFGLFGLYLLKKEMRNVSVSKKL